MSERELYLGIDPGNSGSLAILDPSGGIVDVGPMPDTMKDIADYFKEFGPRIRMAMIEAVHAFPASGPKCPACKQARSQGVSSTFAFGTNFGALQMALAAHDIPYEFVQSRAWQSPLGLLRLTKEESKTDKKNRHKARAQELFPRQKVVHAIADGLLIAETARRRHGKGQP